MPKKLRGRAAVMWYAAGLSEYKSKRACYVVRAGTDYEHQREEPSDIEDLYAIFFDGYLVWCKHGDSQNYFSKRSQSLVEVRREIQAALRGQGKGPAIPTA